MINRDLNCIELNCITLTLCFLLEVVQPPTSVNILVTGKSTARVTWNSVSNVVLYQVTVSPTSNPRNAVFIKNTTNLFMDISDLAPCINYTVGVSSLNVFLVPGQPSTTTVAINSEYFCNSNY